MTDYSIECALPYVNDLKSEQVKFAKALDQLIKDFDSSAKTYNRVLLVDDVTNDGGTDYDLGTYTSVSTGEDQSVLVFRESMLDPQVTDILSTLESKIDDGRRLRTSRGFSSPFYIAIWNLVRLGKIDHKDFPASRVSKRIMNVLPETFRKGEEESIELIRLTQFAESAADIEYLYI